jgi:hypothetical protein
VAAVGAIGMFVLASSATAHFQVSRYTRSGGSCADRLVDPINVIFFGRKAYPSHAAQALEKWGGWTYTSGSVQSIWTHGNCHAQLGQRADKDGGDRDHGRLFQNEGLDSKGRYVTVMDAHRDRVACRENTGPGTGHDCAECHKNQTPNGSNHARERVSNFVVGHTRKQRHRYFGGSGKIKQCDGKYAHADGDALWVSMP